MNSYPWTMTTRRGIAIAAAVIAATTLTSCSAGQISQTANQVAAVDGASADSAGGEIAIRDAVVTVNDNADAYLSFLATNQDPNRITHQLNRVTVDGHPVDLKGATTIDAECTLVGDSPEALKTMPTIDDEDCVTRLEAPIRGGEFPLASNVTLAFSFDTGDIETVATVSAPHLESGENTR